MVRGAGAHGARAPSPPAARASSGHHLPAGDGVRKGRVRAPGWTGGLATGAQRTAQWRSAQRGRACMTEQRSGTGAPRPAGGRAREWEPTTWTGTQRGAGQNSGLGKGGKGRHSGHGAQGKGAGQEGLKGTPRSRQQGARGSGAKRQMAGEGAWPWVNELTGVPRIGIWDGGEM